MVVITRLLKAHKNAWVKTAQFAPHRHNHVQLGLTLPTRNYFHDFISINFINLEAEFEFV